MSYIHYCTYRPYIQTMHTCHTDMSYIHTGHTYTYIIQAIHGARHVEHRAGPSLVVGDVWMCIRKNVRAHVVARTRDCDVTAQQVANIARNWNGSTYKTHGEHITRTNAPQAHRVCDECEWR